MNIDTNAYVGIPYSECNCWDLVCRVYEDYYNMHLPNIFGMDYKGESTAPSFIRKVWDSNRPFIDSVQVEEPHTGDIVLLRVRGLVKHVGVFIEPRKLLHSLSSVGVVLEPMRNIEVDYRVIGYYRVGRS